MGPNANEIPITSPLAIVGAGPCRTIVTQAFANPLNGRLFCARGIADVDVEGLGLQGAVLTIGNMVDGYDGGTFLVDGPSVRFTSCRFADNVATDVDGLDIEVGSGSARIEHCEFASALGET